jgi:translocation and assembly module TamB
VKKLEEGAVQPSPDTIVHGRDIVVGYKSPPLFVLDGLQVRLGERVTFEGFGLKTNLTGGLRLSQSLEADPALVTGAGVVSLREGQFTGFGQKLAINRGSLLFSGVVTDPGLDVKASREVTYQGRDVTVGVLLSGKLSSIQTKIFSEPAMGELDALSYLTTASPVCRRRRGSLLGEQRSHQPRAQPGPARCATTRVSPEGGRDRGRHDRGGGHGVRHRRAGWQ